MKSLKAKRSHWVGALALVALLFGLLTIASGGATLFNAQARQMAGNIVAFILWFNFLAGFAYVIAGIGLWRLQRWSLWLSFAIAIITLVMFGLFGIEVLNGGLFEMRTVGAMSLRAIVWLAISVVAYKHFNVAHIELRV